MKFSLNASTPRFATSQATRRHFAWMAVAGALYSGQAMALALLDAGGNLLGPSVEAKSKITFTPTDGSGNYTVTAAPNAQGLSGTITHNEDGSYTFSRPTEGAWAGYYAITVTDNAGGDNVNLAVAVPPGVRVGALELLGIGGMANVEVLGGAAGVTYTVRALDASGNNATGVLATFEGDFTAWDYPFGSNPAMFDVKALNVAEDAKFRVAATAPGLPQGESSLVVLIAAELFTGTVQSAGGPVYPAWLVAEGRRTIDNNYFWGYCDETGHFSFAGPKGTTSVVAAADGYSPAGAPAAECLTGCTLTLGVPGTDQLVGRRVGTLVDDTTTRMYLGGFDSKPVVIAGVPTSNAGAPGVARVSNVEKDGFDLRFAEWEYLNGQHGEEDVDALALAPGRYNLPDGSVWEVGSFKLGNTGDFRNVSFSAPFLGAPRLFLTVQTENEADVVTVRAKGVTATGFRAALYEQEAKMDGHLSERVGYVAIYNPLGYGHVNVADEDVYYQAWGIRLRSAFTDMWDGIVSFRLQEEQSLDAETDHPYEAVDVMYLEGGMFGQDVSSRNRDTVSLRRR